MGSELVTCHSPSKPCGQLTRSTSKIDSEYTPPPPPPPPPLHLHYISHPPPPPPPPPFPPTPAISIVWPDCFHALPLPDHQLTPFPPNHCSPVTLQNDTVSSSYHSLS